MQMSGTVVGAHKLRVELPWAEQQAQHPAGEPAAAAPALVPAAPVVPEATAPPPAGPQFKLLVVNVGNAMPADQLAAYFRCSRVFGCEPQRASSCGVMCACCWHSARHACCFPNGGLAGCSSPRCPMRIMAAAAKPVKAAAPTAAEAHLIPHAPSRPLQGALPQRPCGCLARWPWLRDLCQRCGAAQSQAGHGRPCAARRPQDWDRPAAWHTCPAGA